MARHRVLIVEDEQDIAGLIKHTLERSGDAEAQIVGTGDAALKAVTERAPDLIILDLNLPVVSGLEVCRILRSRADVPHVPIIMPTARTSEDDRVSGLDQGADDWSKRGPSTCTWGGCAVRVRHEITAPSWAPMHPVWLRCSSLAYSRYAHSSRLARPAPRHPGRHTYFVTDPKLRTAGHQIETVVGLGYRFVD